MVCVFWEINSYVCIGVFCVFVRENFCGNFVLREKVVLCHPTLKLQYVVFVVEGGNGRMGGSKRIYKNVERNVCIFCEKHFVFSWLFA